MNWPRAILHVDMDAFYASVEQRDNPRLLGQPVIVGGTGHRGVVSAASYEARAFGVRSAMPGSKARRLCPDGVFLRGRMSVYRDVSRQIHKIFQQFTPDIEPLSLDEAFLDITSNQRLMTPEQAAEKIKQQIREQLRLVASVGLAPNKFVAKLASDRDKPDGLCVVKPEQVLAFIDPLPVSAIWGLGKQTAAKLQRAGIHIAQQLRLADTAHLIPMLGNRTAHYQALASGVDDRPVQSRSADKSISNEITFDVDARSQARIEATLLSLSDKVARRLRTQQYRAKTVVIKIRQANFTTFTRQRQLIEADNRTDVIYETARALLLKWWREQGHCAIRLIGVGTTQLLPYVPEAIDQNGKDAAIDAVKNRFGADALTRGRLINSNQKT